MPRWVHSRRLKVCTLAAIGLLTAGSCGGALLANYTVAGMDPTRIARAEPRDTRPQRSTADWLADEAVRTDPAFADPWKPAPAAASDY